MPAAAPSPPPPPPKLYAVVASAPPWPNRYPHCPGRRHIDNDLRRAGMPSSTLLLGRRRTAAPPSATPKGYPHGKLAGVKKKRIFGNKKFRCWKPKKHSIVVVSLFVWSTVPNPCGIEGAAHANTHAILWSPPHRCRNVCIISSKTCGHPARRRRTNAISWLSSAPPRDVQNVRCVQTPPGFRGMTRSKMRVFIAKMVPGA